MVTEFLELSGDGSCLWVESFNAGNYVVIYQETPVQKGMLEWWLMRLIMRSSGRYSKVLLKFALLRHGMEELDAELGLQEGIE